jgi:hypothetical protein
LVFNQTYPKSMKKAILLASLFLQSLSVFSQIKKLEDVCQIFHLPDGKDTTTFVVWGSKKDLKIKKPLFFFRQGSQPYPLIENRDGRFMPFYPFPLEDITDKYHFVMVQKLGTELVVDSTYLNAFSEGMKTSDSKYLTKNTWKIIISTKQLPNAIK